MIRKMLVIAAAVAMPAAAVAGMTAIGGAGIASAKALPPLTGTCALTGTVTFAEPGLSYDGTLTNKSVETTKTAITPSGICGTKAIKSKINSTPTACATASPAPACGLATAKTLAKDPDYYDTASSLATSGVSQIVTSLAAGIPAVDNGTKVTLQVTSGGTGAVLPGGACGSTTGFALTGAVTNGGTAVSSYSLTICLTGDSGSGTSGSFFPDYLSAAGGNTTVTIAGATLGAGSQLVFS